MLSLITSCAIIDNIANAAADNVEDVAPKARL